MKGRKKTVYILVKILKWLTGSSAESFHCKSAWNEVLIDGHTRRVTDISEEEMGIALIEVINHRTIRGKFSSVHPDLRAAGVTRLELGSQGITFHRDPIGLDGTKDENRTSQAADWARKLGHAALEAEDYQRAVLHYEKSLNLDPDVKESWIDLATALSKTNSPREVGPLNCDFLPFTPSFFDTNIRTFICVKMFTNATLCFIHKHCQRHNGPRN